MNKRNAFIAQVRVGRGLPTPAPAPEKQRPYHASGGGLLLFTKQEVAPRELERTLCRRFAIAAYEKVASSTRLGGSIAQLTRLVN